VGLCCEAHRLRKQFERREFQARDLSLQTPAARVCYPASGVSVSAPGHYLPIEQCLYRCEATAPGTSCGAGRLRWLIRRIAGDDRAAFAEFFDCCSGQVARELSSQITDPRRVAGVLAGTFVEVWWLAGCHADPDSDVLAWIDQIVRRRVADSRPALPAVADSAGPGPGRTGASGQHGVEVELIGLLRYHPARLVCVERLCRPRSAR